MSFLEEHFVKLKPRVPPGNSSGELAAWGFMLPWNHDNAYMDIIMQALSILRPKVMMELGTFEAAGTIKMAECLDQLSHKCTFYTFDAGHSPANSLGGSDVYGVPKSFEEQPLVDWKNFPKKHRSSKEWRSWGKIIQARNERLKEMRGLSNVKVKYVEGITFDILPKVMPKIGTWDFCFQDTLHSTYHITKEWKLYREFTKIGSVVVFDDVGEPHNFDLVNWFVENEPDWICKHTDIGGGRGDGQLWAERMK